MKTGLFVGRFQPFHKAHYKIINKISKEVDYLIIGVGSSNKHHTIDNPFTLKERVDMINASLEIDNYTIKHIPDLDDYGRWVKHALNITGKVDVVFTGNKLVKELFEKEGLEVKVLNSKKSYISATMVRDMISKSQPWEKYVTKEAAKAIKESDGEKRIKDLLRATEKLC